MQRLSRLARSLKYGQFRLFLALARTHRTQREPLRKGPSTRALRARRHLHIRLSRRPQSTGGTQPHHRQAREQSPPKCLSSELFQHNLCIVFRCTARHPCIGIRCTPLGATAAEGNAITCMMDLFGAPDSLSDALAKYRQMAAESAS